MKTETSNKEAIYQGEFVENLFNRMSQSYGVTNYISSFGFTERWRRQCVNEINWNFEIKKGFDLMSGMGETWRFIKEKSNTKIIGVDLSSEMNRRAKAKLSGNRNRGIEIREENILKSTIASGSADFIVSAFGIKTFSREQQKKLAKEIYRILKKGGQLSIIEVSEPKGRLLKWIFMFYLKYLIPLIGRLFLGNPMDYKMLGIYCEKFRDCHHLKEQLEQEGMQVEFKEYFFGCATGIVGHK